MISVLSFTPPTYNPSVLFPVFPELSTVSIRKVYALKPMFEILKGLGPHVLLVSVLEK